MPKREREREGESQFRYQIRDLLPKCALIHAVSGSDNFVKIGTTIISLKLVAKCDMTPLHVNAHRANSIAY